jgi:hypothetical protein
MEGDVPWASSCGCGTGGAVSDPATWLSSPGRHHGRDSSVAWCSLSSSCQPSRQMRCRRGRSHTSPRQSSRTSSSASPPSTSGGNSAGFASTHCRRGRGGTGRCLRTRTLGLVEDAGEVDRQPVTELHTSVRFPVGTPDYVQLARPEARSYPTPDYIGLILRLRHGSPAPCSAQLAHHPATLNASGTLHKTSNPVGTPIAIARPWCPPPSSGTPRFARMTRAGTNP